jgi:poly(A) polymerase
MAHYMTDLEHPDNPASPDPEAPASAPAAPEAGPSADDLDAWGNPVGAIPRALLDPDAVKILRRLRRHGFTAYLVGGGVRDLLLGRTPKDFDIATSARPEEVKRLFRNCRIIGRRFRLAHVFFREKIIEVSTFRALVEPVADGDGVPAEPAGTSDVAEQVDLLIRTDNVFGTAEEDAIRRDFTINGLFYTPGDQVRRPTRVRPRPRHARRAHASPARHPAERAAPGPRGGAPAARRRGRGGVVPADG